GVQLFVSPCCHSIVSFIISCLSSLIIFLEFQSKSSFIFYCFKHPHPKSCMFLVFINPSYTLSYTKLADNYIIFRVHFGK
ncbi:hypothetical protein Taro_025110, partial [Colocasia esculenta]|nr:hypothetical protein [Colocasia esculenta]